MSTRLLLVDDHEVFLDGLAGLLEKEDDFEIAGRVTNGLEVPGCVRKVEPDLVVMDLGLPGLNGVEAARRITVERPDLLVLALSMHSAAHFVEEALDAGVRGYVLKEYAYEEVVRGIRALLAGGMFLSAGAAEIVVRGWRSTRVPADGSAYAVLTEREREVLQLMAEGFSSKEIAAKIHVSVKTVGTHREHIMEKTDIHNLAGLTKYAVAEGLTDLETGLGPDRRTG